MHTGTSTHTDTCIDVLCIHATGTHMHICTHRHRHVHTCVAATCMHAHRHTNTDTHEHTHAHSLPYFTSQFILWPRECNNHVRASHYFCNVLAEAEQQPELGMSLSCRGWSLASICKAWVRSQTWQEKMIKEQRNQN